MIRRSAALPAWSLPFLGAAMLVACGKSTRTGPDLSPNTEGGVAGCSGAGCAPRAGSGSSGAGEGGGGGAGAPSDTRCVVALTLDAPCCFAGFPCSCAPTALRRSELALEACKVESPAVIEDVPSNVRTACSSTPDGGCDPVTCVPASYFAFESAAGGCEWCRHEGATPNAEVTGRAPDGTCLFRSDGQ